MKTSNDIGLSKTILGNQHGGMAVLAVSVIFCAILILFMAINVGNIWATKNQLEDAAKAMSEIVLQDQLTKSL